MYDQTEPTGRTVMPNTIEAATICANPECTQPKRHGGPCDDETTFDEVIIKGANHLRRLMKYPPVSPFARRRVEARVHAAADRVVPPVPYELADWLLADEIQAGPVND